MHPLIRPAGALAMLATGCWGGLACGGDADPGPPQAPSAPAAAQAATIVVSGRSDSEVGVADSAAQGTTGQADLENRPLLRVGEIMETIPGMIATEHSGGGKANQYFLRGFDLDHGTDFATSVDGAPINLRSHAHGQGYTDLTFLIPEVISTIDYRKGPYAAQDGDFGAAGSADIHYADALPHGIASATLGVFSYERGLLADSTPLNGGNLLYAVDAEHYDGPWDHANNFRRINGLVRYSDGDRRNGWSVTGSAYAGSWYASDQIPRRAVDEGIIDIYGNLNPTDGGASQRYEVTADWHAGDATQQTEISVFALSYRLDLFSDFTYFLADPVNGDQFEQRDRRIELGGALAHHWTTAVGGLRMENTVGLQERSDLAPEVGLFHTVDRVQTAPSAQGRLNGLGATATVEDDRVDESSVAVYGESRIAWTPWLRSVIGLRGDLYSFAVDSDDALNSGSRSAAIASPKGTLIVGPWERTEFYLNAGLGFHSNDARGVVQKVDPSTGLPVSPATPLVRSKGAEIGARSDAIDDVHSTLGLYVIELDSELLIDGDTGVPVPTVSPTRRLGLEWSNSARVGSWLLLDGDVSYTYARFVDDVPAEGGGYGRFIPGAIPVVLTLGGTSFLSDTIYTTLRLRFFSRRPLNETDSVESTPSAEVNARIGYRRGGFEAHLDLLNLLNRRDDDQSYYYQSQLRTEAAPVEDIHVHPNEPFEIRGEVSYAF
jgi:hypothetical protein